MGHNTLAMVMRYAHLASPHLRDAVERIAGALTATTTAGGTFVQYIIYVNANTTNQVNQTARIYADPGSTVQAFAFNPAPASSCAGFVTVSGHLVDLP